MRSRLVRPYPWIRIALLVLLTVLLSAWGTCNAMVEFNSCPGAVPATQLSSLSPGAIFGNSESVLLIVSGSGFTPRSRILWDGSALPTVFIDPQHLETTVTQQTLSSFGGSAGSSVHISVRTLGSGVRCPDGDSAALELVIN